MYFFSRLVNLGQVLVSASGPIAVAVSGAVSATWFPPHQRATATAIANRLQSLGAGLTFIVGRYVYRYMYLQQKQ